MRRPSSDTDEAASARAAAIQTDLQRRLAANIRRLRAARGWGQEEGAWRANIAVRAYQRLESGTGTNPTFSTLSRLCVAFAVDVGDLLKPGPQLSPGRPGRPKGRTAPTVADPQETAASRTTDPPVSDATPAVPTHGTEINVEGRSVSSTTTTVR